MDSTLLGILGIVMIYSWGHFVYIQFGVTYINRTSYEKFVTWFAIITLVLFIFGSI